MLISWARGGSLFSRGRGYNVSPGMLSLSQLGFARKECPKQSVQAILGAVQCILEFPSACGITVGTPLRVRLAIDALEAAKPATHVRA
jgi:hypothetical protein